MFLIGKTVFAARFLRPCATWGLTMERKTSVSGWGRKKVGGRELGVVGDRVGAAHLELDPQAFGSVVLFQDQIDSGAVAQKAFHLVGQEPFFDASGPAFGA